MNFNINVFAIGMFIISPLVFFCSKNENAMVLGVVFLVLGFICKWIGKNNLNPIVKLSRKNYWEENYKAALGSVSANKDKPNAEHDESARAQADMVTRWANIPLPTEEEKDKISLSMGVAPYKMQREASKRAEDKWNRIQYEKYRQLGEFESAISWEAVGKNCSFPWRFIERVPCPLESYVSWSRKALKNSLNYYSVLEEAPWDKPLSPEEKAIADQWVKEYKERFMKEVNEYIEKNTPMPTIKYHFQNGGNSLYTDYNVKYGFVRKIGE